MLCGEADWSDPLLRRLVPGSSSLLRLLVSGSGSLLELLATGFGFLLRILAPVPCTLLYARAPCSFSMLPGSTPSFLLRHLSPCPALASCAIVRILRYLTRHVTFVILWTNFKLVQLTKYNVLRIFKVEYDKRMIYVECRGGGGGANNAIVCRMTLKMTDIECFEHVSIVARECRTFRSVNELQMLRTNVSWANFKCSEWIL